MLFEVPEERSKEPAPVARNLVLNRAGITAPIVGPRRMAHVEESLGAVSWELSEDHLDRLDEGSAKRLPYPDDMIQ